MVSLAAVVAAEAARVRGGVREEATAAPARVAGFVVEIAEGCVAPEWARARGVRREAATARVSGLVGDSFADSGSARVVRVRRRLRGPRATAAARVAAWARAGRHARDFAGLAAPQIAGPAGASLAVPCACTAGLRTDGEGPGAVRVGAHGPSHRLVAASDLARPPSPGFVRDLARARTASHADSVAGR